MLKIEIPEETIEIENNRPPEKMQHDDFLWCVNVVFSFMDNALVIEASIFGFLHKMLGALNQVVSERHGVVLNDEYGAYQIHLSLSQGQVQMDDSFGNGSVVLPLDQLLDAVKVESSRTFEELEAKIPSLVKNQEYIILKSEIETNTQKLSQKFLAPGKPLL